MTDDPGWSRRGLAAGVAALFGPVLTAVAMAHPPFRVLVVEGGLLLCGALWSGTVVALLPRIVGGDGRGRFLTTAVNLALITAIFGVLSPFSPVTLPLTWGVLAITQLARVLAGGDQRPLPGAGTAAAGLAALATVGAVGVATGRGGPADVAMWLVLLLGFDIVLMVHWRSGRAELDRRLTDLAAVAHVAHRLGGSTELADISGAVLDGVRTLYPHLNWGGVLLLDRAAGVLRPLPESFAPVAPGRPAAHEGRGAAVVRPGEGLAGLAVSTGRIQWRACASEMARDSATRRPGLETYIRRDVGTVQSAVAAPLNSAGGDVVGVISLGSTLAPYRWATRDLGLIQSIADQAGTAIERALLYQEQKRHASTDSLTGLPNRREFERTATASPRGEAFAILAIDVDRLKSVNDSYGHEAGDRLLEVVARALAAALRPEDMVARIGGDEFAIHLPGATLVEAQRIARRLVDGMQGIAAPFGTATISVGCAASSGAADEPREVWRQADAALLRAKVAGRDRVMVAAPEAPAHEAVRWSDLIPGLFQDRRIRSAYQRIVRISDRSIVGYEALARPEGFTSVDALFEAALHLGMIREMDWACRRAALEHARWLDPSATLFINVSVAALTDRLHDVDQMLLLLRWAGRSPQHVVLEINERETVGDLARLREVVASHRAHGFRFALDDVGEGHSTLENLAAITPEFIKIARHFTRSAAEPGARAAIEALVTFARSTETAVIAEGIETDRDLAALSDLGVGLAQGYHLGPPVGSPAGIENEWRHTTEIPGRPLLPAPSPG